MAIARGAASPADAKRLRQRHCYECGEGFWLRGQDLNLRPADPAGDSAANAGRISGYGALREELPRPRTRSVCGSVIVMIVERDFGCGGRI